MGDPQNRREEIVRPLEGLKVVELGFWWAGPAAGMVLGECGADVIKVESLAGGDPLRGFAAEELHGHRTPLNYQLELVNRNKRSMAVDLRQPEGQDIVYRLIRTSDVFVTNLRPGALERLKMDTSTLMDINPRLIYGLLTAFGPEGPDRNKPGFDEVGFWARSGFLSFMGEPEAPPTPLHGAMGDLTTAVCLVAGVAMALLVRERTGRGQVVDTSLLSSGMWVAGFDLQTTLFTGVDVLRRRRTEARSPLYNTYQCGDGRWVQFTMPQTDRFWGPMCRALEIPHLESDERYNSQEKLIQRSGEVVALFDQALARRPLKEWAPRFDQEELVWAYDARLSEVISDPQVAANRFLAEVSHPSLGALKEVGVPFRLRDTPPHPSGTAPEWGQHTEEVLQELGCSWEEILALKDSGVIS
ncbi:MAG: CaiB/BaiF CoA transferase family protein [Dehalococcoidia bacterium]